MALIEWLDSALTLDIPSKPVGERTLVKSTEPSSLGQLCMAVDANGANRVEVRFKVCVPLCVVLSANSVPQGWRSTGLEKHSCGPGVFSLTVSRCAGRCRPNSPLLHLLPLPLRPSDHFPITNEGKRRSKGRGHHNRYSRSAQTTHPPHPPPHTGPRSRTRVHTQTRSQKHTDVHLFPGVVSEVTQYEARCGWVPIGP